MAVKRVETGQFLSLLLIFLGVVLLSSSGTFYYLGSRFLPDIPINIDQELRMESVGFDNNRDSVSGRFSVTVLNMCSLNGSVAATTTAQVISQQHLFSVRPAGLDKVTYQMNSIYYANAVLNAQKKVKLNLSRGDLSQITCSDGVLRGSVDLVTVSRKTGLPLPGDQNASSISFDPTRAAREISHRQGFQYYLPPHVLPSDSYKYFDPITEQTAPLRYINNEKIHGRMTLHFIQNVPARDMSELLLTDIDLSGKKIQSPPPLSILVKPSSWWKIKSKILKPAQRQALQMHKFASVIRDIWVDQDSGIMIRQKESLKEEYRLRNNSPITAPALRQYALPVYYGTLISDEDSEIMAINLANDYSRKNTLGYSVIPLVFLVIGLGVLSSGVALLTREIIWRRRVEKYISQVNFESIHQPVEFS